MGGLSRRELLQRSAVAGGLVWAAPLLSSSRAWGSDGSVHCCACDSGELIYSKFAPGNSQTCVNQCLQPGNISRFEFDCLVDAGLLAKCDDVTTNDDTASIAFGPGITPMKFAIKGQDNCYITRCNEGFSKVFRWGQSFNSEAYDGLPACTTGGGGNSGACVFPDPATTADNALFQVYTGGTGPASERCLGAIAGSARPEGTRCGHTASGTPTGSTSPAGPLQCPCDSPISGVFMTTVGIGDKLNFIEMVLCVTNVSKINCVPLDCTKGPSA